MFIQSCMASTQHISCNIKITCVFQTISFFKNIPCLYSYTNEAMSSSISCHITPSPSKDVPPGHYQRPIEILSFPFFPLYVMATYLLTSTNSAVTNTEWGLNESLEQLENMKEHILFLIDSVISSLITSACQRKASDNWRTKEAI